MTLKTGDRLFFDVTTSHMTLQFVSHENLERDANCDPDGHPVAVDTVVLTGADAAEFTIALLGMAKTATIVEKGRPGTSSLAVERGKFSGGSVSFVGDNNTITLTNPERSMVREAVRSRVWRMFQ